MIYTVPPVAYMNPVAPYMGAWIEMVSVHPNNERLAVAPYMGAWIEIQES